MRKNEAKVGKETDVGTLFLQAICVTSFSHFFGFSRFWRVHTQLVILRRLLLLLLLLFFGFFCCHDMKVKQCFVPRKENEKTNWRGKARRKEKGITDRRISVFFCLLHVSR